MEPKVYVYNFQNLKLLEVVETCENTRGVCSVSPSKEICVLAVPDKKAGSVRIIHFDKGNKTTLIDAHQQAISSLALNHEGTILASASQTGTLIRLWDTENGSKLQELRRGTDSVDIYWLLFDPLSKYLTCSSSKGTIHVFAVRQDLVQSVAAKAGIK